MSALSVEITDVQLAALQLRADRINSLPRNKNAKPLTPGNVVQSYADDLVRQQAAQTAGELAQSIMKMDAKAVETLKAQVAANAKNPV